MTTINRKHKDGLFRKIFSEQEEILSLYNALNGSNYTLATNMQVTTIEDVIFIGYKNDISILIDQRLGIYEHQSSWCGNMPLRDLIYVGKTYSAITAKQRLHGSKKIKIPNPHFVVFYNGVQKRPEREFVKLSDSFEHPEGDVNLELKVLVLNINEGYNKELMEQCPKLEEYSYYVARVREYSQGKIAIEQAIKRAVNECIKNDVLAKFLLKHREEVEEMCLGEFNLEEYLEAEKEYIREEGHKEGHKEGREQGRKMEKEQSIKVMIETLRELNLGEDMIKTTILEKFQLCEKDYEEFI